MIVGMPPLPLCTCLWELGTVVAGFAIMRLLISRICGCLHAERVNFTDAALSPSDFCSWCHVRM